MIIADLNSHPSQYPEPPQFLIIGYGEEYHGDDGVGPYVAKLVADWRLPSVRTMAVAALSLDLVAPIAESRYVIFVDACHHRYIQSVYIDPIGPASFPANHDHDRPLTPTSLLSLAQTLYQCQTQVWAIHVATVSFAPGARMSAIAYYGCDRAIRTIAQFLVTYRQSPQPSLGSSITNSVLSPSVERQ
ncbi:MAG: hydrogenase maturation protease [Cyanothece sp. SIO2G6]|nr:hydrogenase maturation protease [Cyanothece sp. SIO2G6]